MKLLKRIWVSEVVREIHILREWDREDWENERIKLYQNENSRFSSHIAC